MSITALPPAPDSSDRENFPTQMDTFLAALIVFRTEVNATAAALGVDATTLLGAGIGDWLATPSSANLRAAITDETGSGSLVFGTSPTIATPALNGATLNGAIKETASTVPAGTTPAISASAPILTWTLSGNSTPTNSLNADENVTLMIDDGTAYTITWFAVTWLPDGVAPTLRTSGYTLVNLWRVGATTYGTWT